MTHDRYLGTKRRWPQENLATAYRPAAMRQNLDQERGDTTPKTFAIGQDVKISGFPGTIVGSPVEPRGYGPVSAGHYVVRTAGGVTLRYADEIDAA